MIDEASMMTSPDLAHLISLAEGAAEDSPWPAIPGSCKQHGTVAACLCSPTVSAMGGWRSPSPGNKPLASACEAATRVS